MYGSMRKTFCGVALAPASINCQSATEYSVRRRMESSVQKIAKSDDEYFQALARHLMASICQVCVYPLPGESDTARMAGGGGGVLRKYFTAWGENTLWILKLFPIDASLDDFSWWHW